MERVTYILYKGGGEGVLAGAEAGNFYREHFVGGCGALDRYGEIVFGQALPGGFVYAARD